MRDAEELTLLTLTLTTHTCWKQHCRFRLCLFAYLCARVGTQKSIGSWVADCTMGNRWKTKRLLTHLHSPAQTSMHPPPPHTHTHQYLLLLLSYCLTHGRTIHISLHMHTLQHTHAHARIHTLCVELWCNYNEEDKSFTDRSHGKGWLTVSPGAKYLKQRGSKRENEGEVWKGVRKVNG